MLPNFELRILKYDAELLVKGEVVAYQDAEKLQYRTREYWAEDEYSEWSDWQDVPVVECEQNATIIQ